MYHVLPHLCFCVPVPPSTSCLSPSLTHLVCWKDHSSSFRTHLICYCPLRKPSWQFWAKLMIIFSKNPYYNLLIANLHVCFPFFHLRSGPWSSGITFSAFSYLRDPKYSLLPCMNAINIKLINVWTGSNVIQLMPLMKTTMILKTRRKII